MRSTQRTYAATLRSAVARTDPASVVRELPPFDGTLKSYYDHLCRSLGADAAWIADIIALVDEDRIVVRDFIIGVAELATGAVR